MYWGEAMKGGEAFMRYLLCSAAFVLLVTPVMGEIVVPPSVEIGRKLVAELEVSGMPEGAELKGIPIFNCPGADILQGPTRTTFHIWAPPKDGEYQITAFGMWGLPHPDVPGAWVDFGFYQYTAAFQVIGEGAPDPPDPPGPDPDPDPPVPGGKCNLVYFLRMENLDKLPIGQRLQVASLSFRAVLDGMGHTLVRVIDDDQISGLNDSWAPWVAETTGKELPLLVIQDKETGDLRSFPMPAHINDVYELLGEDEWQ